MNCNAFTVSGARSEREFANWSILTGELSPVAVARRKPPLWGGVDEARRAQQQPSHLRAYGGDPHQPRAAPMSDQLKVIE